MKLKIEINMDNAAFEEMGSGNEVARILRCIAGRIMESSIDEETGFKLFDINGNNVGNLEVE